MCVIVKIRCFCSLQSKLQKLSTLLLETFTNKNSLRNLTRFNGGLFESEILEIFTTAFLLKIIIWTWISFQHCRVLSLKTKKNLLKEDSSHLKIADIVRDRRITLKKEKEKRKMRKSQTTTIFFLLFILYIEKYVFC